MLVIFPFSYISKPKSTSGQVHYPASLKEGILSALLLKRKNGDRTHGHSGALTLNNVGQKVTLMVTVKEILE